MKLAQAVTPANITAVGVILDVVTVVVDDDVGVVRAFVCTPVAIVTVVTVTVVVVLTVVVEECRLGKKCNRHTAPHPSTTMIANAMGAGASPRASFRSARWRRGALSAASPSPSSSSSSSSSSSRYCPSGEGDDVPPKRGTRLRARASLRDLLLEARRGASEKLQEADAALAPMPFNVPQMIGGAAVSIGALAYLASLVAAHWHGGLSALCRKVLLEDAYGSISVTVLLLYTGLIPKLAEALMTQAAQMIQPVTMNTWWWISLAITRSCKYVKKMITATLTWALASQVFSLIPKNLNLITIDPDMLSGDIDSIFSGINAFGMFLSMWFDTNKNGTVTSSEVQMVFVRFMLKLLWVYFAFTVAQWGSELKEPPTLEVIKQHTTLYAREDGVSQAINKHFAGLRGDEGIEWEVQARSALVDKALSVSILLFAAYTGLNALGVNMTGLLAIGGVSGIAIGFAAQKLVSNFISGILIFVTQPFVEGDHIVWKDIEGKVDEVGWHSTRIQSTEHGYAFIVPNTDILGAALRNLSRRKFHPIVVNVDVPEDIDPASGVREFVSQIERLLISRVDSTSVSRPKVRLEYGANVDEPRRVVLKAFIQESIGFEKVNDLKAALIQDVATYLRKRGPKPASQ